MSDMQGQIQRCKTSQSNEKRNLRATDVLNKILSPGAISSPSSELLVVSFDSLCHKLTPSTLCQLTTIKVKTEQEAAPPLSLPTTAQLAADHHNYNLYHQ